MLTVYNETTKKWVDRYDYFPNLVRGIVYADDNYIEFGYFETSEHFKIANIKDFDNIPILSRNCHIPLYFNRATGRYAFVPPETEVAFACGEFPYSFQRFYSTRYLESAFQKRRHTESLINFNYINELPYTFGLEFETSAGYIPEDDLFRTGLIPLRDGSISGLEYSTVVLGGNLGLNTLKEQVELLKEYTIFDKECSLHIHFGGFKLDPKVLLRLNNLFATSDIDSYLVRYAFNTARYKASRKEYCMHNLYYSNFNDLYKSLVEVPYFGNLFQPHPSDIRGEQKWHIHSRYKALNLVNAVCYNNAKTAEFRVLRPTYNFNKILVWLFVFGAFIKYAENLSLKAIQNISVHRIINSVYSPELANLLIRALKLQKEVTQTQILLGDYIGMRVDVEDQILTYKNYSKDNIFFYLFKELLSYNFEIT